MRADVSSKTPASTSIKRDAVTNTWRRKGDALPVAFLRDLMVASYHSSQEPESRWWTRERYPRYKTSDSGRIFCHPPGQDWMSGLVPPCFLAFDNLEYNVTIRH
jgi:hypothetical protein